MPIKIDKDCNSEYPHRSEIVINKKKYDEYCFNIKKCSRWNDSLKDDKGNPIPWFHECTSNTYKKLPILTRGTICTEIKQKYGSFEDISANLVDFKNLFNLITDNYIDKYVHWMKFPSNNNKVSVDKNEESWNELKRDLIKERNKINKLSKEYTERVNGVNKLLGKERNAHKVVTDNLKDAKKRLLSMGGNDMKTNMYNSTSGHIIHTTYYITALIIMGIFLTKLN